MYRFKARQLPRFFLKFHPVSSKLRDASVAFSLKITFSVVLVLVRLVGVWRLFRKLRHGYANANSYVRKRDRRNGRMRRKLHEHATLQLGRELRLFGEIATLEKNFFESILALFFLLTITETNKTSE